MLVPLYTIGMFVSLPSPNLQRFTQLATILKDTKRVLSVINHCSPTIVKVQELNK